MQKQLCCGSSKTEPSKELIDINSGAYLLPKTATAALAAFAVKLEVPLLLISESRTSSSLPGRLPGSGEGSTKVATGIGVVVASHAGSIVLHSQHAA